MGGFDGILVGAGGPEKLDEDLRFDDDDDDAALVDFVVVVEVEADDDDDETLFPTVGC